MLVAPDVTIGLLVSQNTSAWRATLASIDRNTVHRYRLLILDDGADIELPSFVQSAEHTAVLSNRYRRGLAFCANSLIDATDTPYLLLLQEGCYVTANWLEDLLSILASRPDYGMVGPSTCTAWNEQQVVNAGDFSPGQIESFARHRRKQYGGEVVYLDTLHSLLPFCYAFKRCVAERVGYFDEGFGVGPCAEVDFTTRAAHAGYHAVWAPGVYVHRYLTGPALEALEAQAMDTARSRYQAKFCGLRHGMQGACPCSFAHCLGEDCATFDPPDSHRSFESRAIPTPIAALPKPLVSCIMPTADRHDFVAQAIRYFQRQDYPELELVIVDDGNCPVRDLAQADERISYVLLPAKMPLGNKRNAAVQASRGAIIAHWDDDDWYGPSRISAQVEPILQDEADITALDMRLVYDAVNGQMWAFSGDMHARLMYMDMHCGTLVYRRRVWEQLAQFRMVNLGEDVLFVQDAFERGARLLKLAARNHFIYIRHASNTWPLACGRDWDERAWQQMPLTDEGSGYPVLNHYHS